jgi:hypothetical protein
MAATYSARRADDLAPDRVSGTGNGSAVRSDGLRASSDTTALEVGAAGRALANPTPNIER